LSLNGFPRLAPYQSEVGIVNAYQHPMMNNRKERDSLGELDVPADTLSGGQGAGLILRLMVIGVVVAGFAGSFLYAGGWFTPHALSC
jgi:hypothetical protein